MGDERNVRGKICEELKEGNIVVECKGAWLGLVSIKARLTVGYGYLLHPYLLKLRF